MTLLVSDHRFTWREWLRAQTCDVVCLDPTDADHGPACRAFLLRAGKVRDWRLIGSVDPLRNPIGIFSAAWTHVAQAGQGAVVQLFAPKTSPVLRQLALAISQRVSAEQILVPLGSGLENMGWPIGAEVIELPAAFPAMVLESQRRARWLEMLEASEMHEIDLADVTIDGARLGSGTRIDLPDWAGWAERTGTVLHMVGEGDLSDGQAARYLDQVHASRISFVSPAEYEGLVCSFSSQEGEDFGIGVVEKFVPERRLMRIRCTAVAPAPVRLLRIGTLRIDSSGRELPDQDSRSL